MAQAGKSRAECAQSCGGIKRPSYPRRTRSSGVRSRTRTDPAIREALESWPWQNAVQRPGVAARINIPSSYVRYRYTASVKAVLVASTRKQEQPDLCLPTEGKAVENKKTATSGENSRLGTCKRALTNTRISVWRRGLWDGVTEPLCPL